MSARVGPVGPGEAPIRVDLVDPSAYTPPYDHALARALARHGAQVRLLTSRFAYGSVPAPEGYAVRECFYRHARGPAGSRRRLVAKLVEHVPDMLALRRLAVDADVVHLQWATVPALDRRLLPDRPLALTAHDLLPREPRPGQLRAQRRLLARADAVVVHSEYGRRRLVEIAGLAPDRVHVIHHGAFTSPASEGARSLPAELAAVAPDVPIVLCFGLIRPYKGIDVLLSAWREVTDAELWIVGRPRMDVAALQADSPPRVRWLTRFVSEAELAALFTRADIVVLPYARTDRFDQSGVLATALGFGRPVVLSDVGGFPEVAATGAAQIVSAGDPIALRDTLVRLIGDPRARERLAHGARRAAAERYSWDVAAQATLRLYATIRRR